MKRYLVAAAVLALGLLICSGISLAQEEEELGYFWGIVSSISSDQIVVIEYNYDIQEDVNVTYALDPKVELKNAESLKDIKEGDNVTIDYAIRDGKKVAKIITIEKPSYEEEYSPSETYEEEFDYSNEETEY